MNKQNVECLAFDYFDSTKIIAIACTAEHFYQDGKEWVLCHCYDFHDIRYIERDRIFLCLKASNYHTRDSLLDTETLFERFT